MKEYQISFEENGREYTGFMIVKCNKIEKISETTFIADKVEIKIDEKIIDIKEINKPKPFLEQAKELKRRFGLWEGKRAGFTIQEEAVELRKEAEKGCGSDFDIRDIEYFTCGGKTSDCPTCGKITLCPDCEETIKICKEIKKE